MCIQCGDVCWRISIKAVSANSSARHLRGTTRSALSFIKNGARAQTRNLSERFQDLKGVHAALHIRLGDVLDHLYSNLSDVILWGSPYNPPLTFYDAVALSLKRKGVNSVHLFANAYANVYHRNEQFPISCAYLTLVPA